MLRGNIRAAIRLLEASESKGVLNLDQDVKDVLRDLHPVSTEPEAEALLTEEFREIDPIVFEQIDSSAILSAALKTKGAAGPSGMDANGWRRILASRNYGKTGEDLRNCLANMLKILCRQSIDPDSEERNVESYLACRLIPLDKNPGVRPIGIGEVLRRIFGKTLISVIKDDIMK
eukprot:TCONS_00040071-protein